MGIGDLFLFEMSPVPAGLGISCACRLNEGVMEAVGLGDLLDVGVLNLPNRSILACFPAASACLIVIASRRAPASCLALAA